MTTSGPSAREKWLSDTAMRIQRAVGEHIESPSFAISVEGSNGTETTALLRRASMGMREGTFGDKIAIAWFHPWMYDQPSEAAKAFALAAVNAFADPNSVNGRPSTWRLRDRIKGRSRTWVTEFRHWVATQAWSDEMRVELSRKLRAQRRLLVAIIDGLDQCDTVQQASALRAALAMVDSVPSVLIVGDSPRRRLSMVAGASELLQTRLDDLVIARFMVPPEPLETLQAQAAQLLASRQRLAAVLSATEAWGAALASVFYPQGNRLRRFILELDMELSDRAPEFASRSETERRSLGQQLAFLRVLSALHADVLHALQARTDGAELLIRLQMYFSNPRDAGSRLARWSSDPQFRELAGQLSLAMCFNRFTGGSPSLVHLLPTRLAAARFLNLDQGMGAEDAAFADQQVGDLNWMERLLKTLRTSPKADPAEKASDFDRRMRILDKELAPARIVGNFLLLAEVARQLDWTDVKERKIAEAVARDAKELAVRAQDTSGMLHCGLVLAGIYVAAENAAGASQEINQANALQGIDEIERIEIIRRTAELEDLKGNKRAAKALWEKAADYAAGTQAPEEALRSIVNAALAYDELQNAGPSPTRQAKADVAQALTAAVGRAALQVSDHERPRLFISYKHDEGECVLNALVDPAPEQFDVLTDRVLAASNEWRGEIYAKVLDADAFLLVLGARYLASEECLFELKTACALRSANPRIRIFWVNLDGRGHHAQLREIQAMNKGMALMDAGLGLIREDVLAAIRDEIAKTLVPAVGATNSVSPAAERITTTRPLQPLATKDNADTAQRANASAGISPPSE